MFLTHSLGGWEQAPGWTHGGEVFVAIFARYKWQMSLQLNEFKGEEYGRFAWNSTNRNRIHGFRFSIAFHGVEGKIAASTCIHHRAL